MLDIREVNFVMNEILDETLRSLMAKYDVPGVSAAGIENGVITWTRQYGMCSVETGHPISAESVFEACSMTKPQFAYAMLKLVEEGKMSLDVPLVQYLERPYIENEHQHKKITAYMVLTHTSGLPNWRPGGPGGDGKLEVHFEPGTDFLYSGEGFLFLQRVVEHLTQKPLDEWMRTKLFEPLKMSRSNLVWTQELANDYAAGHDERGQCCERVQPFQSANAAFSLYTTPTDYAKFILEILNPERSACYSLGKAMLDEMLMPHEKVPNKLPYAKSTFRGLGWEIIETERHLYHGHSGNNKGFRCYHQFDKKAESGFVMMTNGDNGAEVWQAVAAEINNGT